MRYFLERAREKSTWAGLATVAAAVGLSVPADAFGSVQDLVTGAAGLALILTREARKS